MATKTKLSSYEKETTKQLELEFTEPAEAGPAKEQTSSGKDYRKSLFHDGIMKLLE